MENLGQFPIEQEWAFQTKLYQVTGIGTIWNPYTHVRIKWLLIHEELRAFHHFNQIELGFLMHWLDNTKTTMGENRGEKRDHFQTEKNKLINNTIGVFMKECFASF